MIAVIFEVEPTDGNPAPYLHIAAGLIDELRPSTASSPSNASRA